MTLSVFKFIMEFKGISGDLNMGTHVAMNGDERAKTQ
jgi:hypothetical protein